MILSTHLSPRPATLRMLLALLLLLAWSASAPGGLITVPPTLSPGDEYRLAFVTSTLTDATSSDISTYNNFVTGIAQSVPQLQALGASWAAIGSTQSVNARDNTQTNPNDLSHPSVPIFLLDGTKIADDNSDLWDGSIDSELRITETGDVISGSDPRPWTGSTGTGSACGSCELGRSAVMVGRVYGAGAQWIVVPGGQSNAMGEREMYAISSVLVVPEPSIGFQLIAAVMGVFGIWRRRRCASDER